MLIFLLNGRAVSFDEILFQFDLLFQLFDANLKARRVTERRVSLVEAELQGLIVNRAAAFAHVDVVRAKNSNQKGESFGMSGENFVFLQ